MGLNPLTRVSLRISMLVIRIFSTPNKKTIKSDKIQQDKLV